MAKARREAKARRLEALTQAFGRHGEGCIAGTVPRISCRSRRGFAAKRLPVDRGRRHRREERAGSGAQLGKSVCLVITLVSPSSVLPPPAVSRCLLHVSSRRACSSQVIVCTLHPDRDKKALCARRVSQSASSSSFLCAVA